MPVPYLPASTVTFLFTDIEGSTKRWEAYPQAMSAALSRHDAILREAIEANGGYIFKTVGDAFCAAFATAPQALTAALDAQRALHAEAWPEETGEVRVRMALHVGTAEERGGDYFGQPVNRVARLLSAGHGGQTLLSLPAQELVRDNLPVGVELRDLGEHRLKDLTRPERVFQLNTTTRTQDFPPLRTLDSRPNNLPLQLTPFIGREKEVAAVSEIILRPDTRLLTLTGPGGTGKTRLALQVGAEMLEEFEDGVWFLELASITDHTLVVSTVARSFAVNESPSQPLIEGLKDYMREKQMLLVLDNFEQVIAAAPLVVELLRAAAGLKIVVTSRVALRVYGEHEQPVLPLSLPPDPAHLPSLDRLAQYEAVRLFIERARATKPDFEINNDNAPAVAEICARLDGLPLAIELAAARIRLLTPQAMLSRIQGRLKLLTGGARDLPARQQTLRSAIEWSYDLLEEGEKQLFRRLSVFQGGRGLEAIEAVCNCDGQLQVDVLDGLESLISKSLLQQREGAEGEPRFWMLETIHEFAREKLEETEEATDIKRAHSQYFAGFAEEAASGLRGMNQVLWLDRMEQEYPNIRAVIAWIADGSGSTPDDAQMAMRMAPAMQVWFQIRGRRIEAEEPAGRILSAMEAMKGGPARARALAAAAYILSGSTEHELAIIIAHESVEMARGIGDKSLLAETMRARAYTASILQTARVATGYAAEYLELARELRDPWHIASSTGFAGAMAEMSGDFERARSLYEQALPMFRRLGDLWETAQTLNGLGSLSTRQGDLARARTAYEEALAVQRELGSKAYIAGMVMNLGWVALNEGNYEQAREIFAECITLQTEIGNRWGIAAVQGNLAYIEYREGNYGQALKMERGHITTMWEMRRIPYVAEGLCTFALVYSAMGQPERAVRLFSAADKIMTELGAVWEPITEIDMKKCIEQLRGTLEPESFQAAWDEGLAMSMEEAVEYALQERNND